MSADSLLENEVFSQAKERYLAENPKSSKWGKFKVGKSLLAVVPGCLSKLYCLSREYETAEDANVRMIYRVEGVTRQYFEEDNSLIQDPGLSDKVEGRLFGRSKLKLVGEELYLITHLPLLNRKAWGDGYGNPILRLDMVVDDNSGLVKSYYETKRWALNGDSSVENYKVMPFRSNDLTKEDLIGLQAMIKAMKPVGLDS